MFLYYIVYNICISVYIRLQSGTVTFRKKRNLDEQLNGSFRNNILQIHERNQLIWNFCEKGPGQLLAGSVAIGYMKKLSEGNELDDVPGRLTSGERQGLLIAIEFIHRFEISIANADYDDRDW